MKFMKTKHLPLIIGISLPLVFILIISLVIFTPSLFVKPQHNFIYTSENSYYEYNQHFKNTYVVKNNKIAMESVPPRLNYTQTKEAPTLYLYDVISDSSHQITFEEAKKYTVDPGPSAPDGYTVAYQYGHDGIFELFGSSSDNNGYFISKGDGKKKLNGLTGDRYRSSGDFKLIGWIK